MNAQRGTKGTLIAGLLGAALWMGSPLVAQADQGKWWNPQERNPVPQQRIERRAQGRQPAAPARHYRVNRSHPRFQNDIVVVRRGSRGTNVRAHRVWVEPVYFRSQELCVIRPVRFFTAVTANIGPLHIRVGDHGHDGWYGCNFCDARYDDYDGYRRHVLRCDDRPRGYRFEVSDWDSDWYDECPYGHDGH